MKKLTKKAIAQLEILAAQKGPMTIKGLKEFNPKTNEEEIFKLVDAGLVRVRKTSGRTDRVEALAEGIRQLNELK